MTRVNTSVICLALSLATSSVACSKEAHRASTPAGRVAEAKTLIDETKQDARRLENGPAGNSLPPEQIVKLTSVLDQLVRHMDEMAEGSQRHGDAAKAKVAADVEELQQVQAQMVKRSGEQGTQPSAQNAPILDRISGNLAKVIQIATQGKELAGILGPPSQPGQGPQPEQSSPGLSPSGDADSSPLPSAQDSAVMPTSTTQPPAIEAAQSVQANRQNECCEDVANATLKGRLGRVVVEFPTGAEAGRTQISLFRSGISDAIRTSYGSLTEEVLPGSYVVEVTGHRVEGVMVRSGHDTRVRAGALRVHAGPSTQITLLDGTRQPISTWYGARDVGLPPGTFHVEVSKQVVPVTIQDGKITNF